VQACGRGHRERNRLKTDDCFVKIESIGSARPSDWTPLPVITLGDPHAGPPWHGSFSQLTRRCIELTGSGSVVEGELSSLPTHRAAADQGALTLPSTHPGTTPHPTAHCLSWPTRTRPPRSLTLVLHHCSAYVYAPAPPPLSLAALCRSPPTLLSPPWPPPCRRPRLRALRRIVTSQLPSPPRD